jgi:hypothetical protein
VATSNTNTVSPNNDHPGQTTPTQGTTGQGQSTPTQGTTGQGQSTPTQGTTGQGQSTPIKSTTGHAGIGHTSPKPQNGHNHVVSTRRQGLNGKTSAAGKSTLHSNQNSNNAKTKPTITGHKTTKQIPPPVSLSSGSNSGYNGINNKNTSGLFKFTPGSGNGQLGVGNSNLLRTTQSSKGTTKDSKLGQGRTKFPGVNNVNQNAVSSTHQVLVGHRNLTGFHGSGGGSYGNGFVGGAGTAGSGSGSGLGSVG